jgi:DNA-3-methyladenine glycosylase I
VRRLLDDAGIVRNEAKILATINNARRCLDLTEEFGSLAAYAWSFEPTQAGAVAMSKDLKRRGWAFVGPTTVYSFMEAVGIVNDHLIGCQMREEVDELRRRFVRPARRKRAARS